LQGNIISGINFSSAGGIFRGIYNVTGSANIGTGFGNIIGSSNGINTIVISNSSSVVQGQIYSIQAGSNSSSTVLIQNNIVGGIGTSGGATIGFVFYGVYALGSASYTIDNNIIGSTTTSNSITLGVNGITTTGSCSMYGIYNRAQTATNSSITNNSVQNCSVYGTGSTSFFGIYNQAGTGQINLNNNTFLI